MTPGAVSQAWQGPGWVAEAVLASQAHPRLHGSSTDLRGNDLHRLHLLLPLRRLCLYGLMLRVLKNGELALFGSTIIPICCTGTPHRTIRYIALHELAEICLQLGITCDSVPYFSCLRQFHLLSGENDGSK